jgi:RNase H-like domain found in reverse transcriptase/Reverse transcriptase (RNA-dependent DNA polymerase)
MFKFCRLGAGLASAPAVFNQLIQSLFSDILWTDVLAFLDDLTLPSRTIDEGIELLSRVLTRLEGAGLKLKASKGKLLQSKVKILGVIVSAGQLCEDESRAEVVRSISFPRTAKELRSLLGFCNFGRSFYKDFAAITAPSTDCLKKGAKIERNAQTLQAFERLKEIMTSSPVLTMFGPSARHIVEADANGVACGAVLVQIGDDDAEKIVAFASRTLTDVQRRWCTTRKELYAVIFALQHWRHYLIGRKIGVRSDHSCLQYLLTSKILTN